MARTCLQMWNGFSSHQFEFGTNPKLRGILINQLPALDGTTASEKYGNHLNAPTPLMHQESEANKS